MRIILNIHAEDWYAAPTWPERTEGQTKMMHFEIEVGDVDHAVARAVSLGARKAPEQPADRDRTTLRVVLDPAGHPLCLWSRGTPSEGARYWHDT